MPDTFNLDINYFTNPKVRRLVGILGPDSEVHHIRLMAYMAQHRPGSGGFDDWSAEEIEGAADWRGEKRKMVEAMVRCGLLHEKNGGYFLHDWKEQQPHLVKYEKTKLERKKASEKRWRQEKRTKKSRNSRDGPEIYGDAKQYAKRDFASSENGFCITSAVQGSAVQETHTQPRAREFSSVDGFESVYSPTYEFIVGVYREVSGSKSLDGNTKAGVRTLTLAVDAGELARDDVPNVIRKGLNDEKLPNQGLRGVANNFSKYLTGKVHAPETTPRRIVAFQCGECGFVSRQWWTLPEDPDGLFACESETGCGGKMRYVKEQEKG